MKRDDTVRVKDGLLECPRCGVLGLPGDLMLRHMVRCEAGVSMEASHGPQGEKMLAALLKGVR